MESLKKNETWDLVVLQNGRKPINNKWVLKKMLNLLGQVEKYNDQLVEKTYSQVKRVEFGEILSHVSKLTSIRVLIYLAKTFDLEIE